MTQPVNPDPEERYLERLRAVWNEDFGTKYRPGLADKLASSDASMEDLARIGAMVRALDAQTTNRLNKQSGAIGANTGDETDLLNAVGAGHEAVKSADYHQHASQDKDLPWWQDVYKWMTDTTVFSFDAQDPGIVGKGIEATLDTIGKVPGFLYREAQPLTSIGLGVPGNDVKLDVVPDGKAPLSSIELAKANGLVEQTNEMTKQGYNPTDVWDNIAFNWSQGESQFKDLDPLRAKYGNELVDLGLDTFRNGGDRESGQYATRVDIENQMAAGEISTEEAVAKINALETPEFLQMYEEMDRKHASFGRDLARTVLPQGLENSEAFTAISGSADALWTFYADPTILGGKIHGAAQVAKWGLESVNDSKIYHMLGEVDEAGVAPAKKYLGSNSRREGVQSFIDTHKQWADNIAAGNEDEAAAIFAGAQIRHKELMPLWSEIGGVRPAITPAERATAAKTGIVYRDANGVNLPGIHTTPITTVREFADNAVNHFAFYRLTNGMAAQARPLLPGRVGIAADRRAIRAEQRTRTGIDRAHDEGLSVINFADAKLNGIIADEAAVKLEEAARLRGEEQFDLADAAELSARKIRYKADAVQRRLSTFLPQGRELNLNSAADAKIVEQFARIFLPKWEAARYASMWHAANPAGRRTLAKALLVQTFEASGLTSSAIGKDMVDKYVNDLDALGRRRYGYGDSDLVSESYRGPFRGGLYESQIDETVSLPPFSEIRQLAAKAAVMGYDPNMTKLGRDAASARAVAMGKGRRVPRLGTTALRYYLFSSKGADRLMHFIKLGWILTPANMARNAGDEALLLSLTGQGGKVNHGRQAMKAAGMRADLDLTKGRHTFLKAMIPKDLRPKVKSVGDAASAISIGRLRTLRNPVTELDAAYAREVGEEQADEVLEFTGGSLVHDPNELPSGLGHEFAQEAAARGVPVARFKFTGYKLDDVDADSGAGLTALINTYGQRFMPGSPANTVLAHMMWHEAAKNPEFMAQLDVPTIEAMQAALPVDDMSYFSALFKADPDYVHAMGLTDEELAMYSGGHEIVPPTGNALALSIVDNPNATRMQNLLELYNIDEAGNKLLPDDVDGLAQARGRMVPRYIEDVGLAVTGRNKVLDPELASTLIRNELPDVNDLRRLGSDALPPHAIKAQYGPVTEGWANGVFDGLTAAMDKGYDLIVTRPLRALIRTPLYVDFYVTARHRTAEMAKQLVETHGWDKSVADELARASARKAALNEVVKFVDNPKVASQFSAMSRNWWSFFRAQEDWLRRYGAAIKADPAIIQKAHLAVIGAEEAGILDRDADGNLILTYPGSGAVIEGFLHFGHFIGWNDAAIIPHVPDLTTRLTFLNPSLNNPFGYSSTPLVSLPWRMIATLAPGGEMLDAVVDRTLNGELGAGRQWYESILPAPISRAYQISSGDADNTGSLVGGAVATAMTHMAINGTLEKYADTPEDRTKAIRDLQTQARNVLYIRAFMALFAPGAPGMPQLADDSANAADYSYQAAGIQTLKQEFDSMVKRMGVGPAYTLWAELHPEASVFMDARRTDSAPGARTPATLDAAGYIMDNKEFYTGEYKAIAPYFIPEAPGEFSDIAWRTMTELGVREYRDLDSMFMDLANANGVNRYFKAKDANDEAVKAARLAGDKARVTQLQADWKAKKAELNVLYPALDDYFAEGVARSRRRMDAVERLSQLVEDPNAPADVQKQLAGVKDMINVFHEYEAQNAALGTARNTQAQADKGNLRVAYHDAMKQLIKRYPSLEDAYNGIFRSLVEQE